MDIRKAILLASSSSGQALIPEDLAPYLVEYLYRVAPLLRRINKETADGRTHEINRRTAVPNAWFGGELEPLASDSSTYDRRAVQMKIFRTPKGGVSGFERAASRSFADALELEILGSVEAMADLYEWSMLWACSDETVPGFTGDAYQCTGLIPYIFGDARAQAYNVLQPTTAGSAVVLSDLDDMLDVAQGFRGVARDDKVFLCSRQMISRIGGLETMVYRVPEYVEFVPGGSVSAYKHVPLVPSDFVSADEGTSPDVVVADHGSLTGPPAGDYYYRISSVTRTGGEQVAGGADNVNAGGNQIDLSWVADATAYLYMIWRGAVGGGSADHDNLYLIDVIAAKGYDSDGLVNSNIAAYADTGATAITTIHPLASGEQNIILMNLNQRRGSSLLHLPTELTEGVQVPAELRAEVGDLTILFGLVELARTRSAWEYELEGYGAFQVPWPRLHSMLRRVKYTA
jgi:hypothetical protein